MKWEPIARVKVAAGTIQNLTTFRMRLRHELFAITLGPSRQLKCSCKRTWTLLPEEVELPEGAITCLHIKLLYGNGSIIVPMSPSARALTHPVIQHGTVYLTPRHAYSPRRQRGRYSGSATS